MEARDIQQGDTNKWCSIDENERQTFLICMGVVGSVVTR